jgi:hypothetical protein
MSNNLKAVREALFAELKSLSDPVIKDNQQLLDNVVKHAGAVKGVCDSIIDTAKVEHNFMRLTERRLPYTDFMSDDVGQQVYNANYYAKIAVDKRDRHVLKLTEGDAPHSNRNE